MDGRSVDGEKIYG
ncbi:hypothetical protein LNQ52_13420 [Klebsiella pneumoniae subsp. pneumoniae]|nr:hypothetical protein [Klebsiella pneumoniae subsp. pneumoniae]